MNCLPRCECLRGGACTYDSLGVARSVSFDLAVPKHFWDEALEVVMICSGMSGVPCGQRPQSTPSGQSICSLADIHKGDPKGSSTSEQ
jgi:hypothetical protein